VFPCAWHSRLLWVHTDSVDTRGTLAEPVHTKHTQAVLYMRPPHRHQLPPSCRGSFLASHNPGLSGLDVPPCFLGSDGDPKEGTASGKPQF
jgi:hypothetical protein